jgi:catechol 2,3-dioxygenase-like lactoylglutathione lyase family enzyme
MSSIYQRKGMRLPRLQHVSMAIRENEQHKVRAFYGEILELQEKTPPEFLQKNGIVWFVAGDNEMELHFVPDKYQPNPEEARHFCLEVNDLAEYRRRIEAAGYPIIEAGPIFNRPRFFTLDPFNNRVELTTIEGDYQESK